MHFLSMRMLCPGFDMALRQELADALAGIPPSLNRRRAMLHSLSSASWEFSRCPGAALPPPPAASALGAGHTHTRTHTRTHTPVSTRDLRLHFALPVMCLPSQVQPRRTMRLHIVNNLEKSGMCSGFRNAAEQGARCGPLWSHRNTQRPKPQPMHRTNRPSHTAEGYEVWQSGLRGGFGCGKCMRIPQEP